MTIQTEHLILAAHLPRHLRALLQGPQEFENVAGLKIADGIRDTANHAWVDGISDHHRAGRR